MSTRWVVGDLLTGRILRTVPVTSGSWSEVLNDAGSLSFTVSLRDADVQRLDLVESARPGKSFLAAISDSTVLAAGPVWRHQYDNSAGSLTVSGAGLYSYFDRRVLLPVLEDGQLPSDAATDTIFSADSLQGVAVAIVEQALSWPDAGLPVVTPAVIAGTAERTYRGADLAPVGRRLRELSEVEGGPDIKFTPRLTSDSLSIEWVMQVGTTVSPLLFSAIEPVFTVGLPGSPVSGLRVGIDGGSIGSQAFVSGGRAAEETLVAVSTNDALTAAGFPLLDLVDSSRSTVSVFNTLQGYADELIASSASPVQSWSLTHRTDQRPFVSGFNVGDFAKVRLFGSHYFPDGEYRLRILSRSGDASGDTVDVVFQPEVI